MKTLISIVGTTGIGKTKLAIDLAKILDTEIVSCDSRQFFRDMEIGTAAPTQQEMSSVKHHFVGNLSVVNDYSIGKFEVDALEKINELFSKKDTVIMVGGSMMYEKAVLVGLNDLPEANEENQQKLQAVLSEKGMEGLRRILAELDPIYFEKVDIDNPRRLLRAIDVIWQTGKKYSELIKTPTHKRNFNVIRIGIAAPREIIYEKINDRVMKMMENGLLQEVENLLPYQDLQSLKTVGYTELFKYLNGEWELEFAVSEIQKNSRRFAKRQLTWYRKEEDINWVDYQNSYQESLSLLQQFNIKI
ncbi:MAG: tRNA (adenosine(37)-N6)-dimethylallyltransferase MiaA [Bacteroidetes bacterium]|nr:tRNA (adenosine(37)-N6)-dimethylallyltransferase MiaA [Bacteroidota bacterium]